MEDVQILFYSPYPDAIVIEKRIDPSTDWRPWQYYAHDCRRRFSLPNEAPLTSQTDVNCKYTVRCVCQHHYFSFLGPFLRFPLTAQCFKKQHSYLNLLPQGSPGNLFSQSTQRSDVLSWRSRVPTHGGPTSRRRQEGAHQVSGGKMQCA